MAYQDILENLVGSLPEIHGAFIYNNQQGVINSQEKITTNNLQKMNIGQVFSKAFFMMSVHYDDISSIRFNYKKMTLWGGKFSENDYLVVLCGPDVSLGMTRITVKMALNNLKENADTLPESQTTAPPVSTQPTISPEELLKPESSLSKPLIQIRQELANLIGPVADVIFDDTLISWTQQFNPSHDTLDKLIRLLEDEIGEDGGGKEFRKRVSKLI